MAQKPHFDNLPAKDYDLLAQGHVIEADYFYFETSPDFDQELAIVFGGYEKCAPDFEIRRKTYPYYIFEYGLAGRCELQVNSQVQVIEPGLVAGFAPGNPHHYRSDPLNPLEHFWIAFVGTNAGELFQRSMLQYRPAVRLWPEALQVMQSLMTQGLGRSHYSQQICRDYLRILLLLLASNIPSRQPSLSASERTFENCRQFIDRNFSTLALPSEAADACNVNIRYMSRLFKSYCGLSPHEYISRLKLNKAANLLLTSKQEINSIARAVGFEDPYHFSRNFKKFHGMSPLKYRNFHIPEE